MKTEVSEWEINPIRLTNEMLEQNGWTRFTSNTDKEFVYFKHKDVAPDIIFPKGNGDYLFCSFEIHYIHEFQHILQLLGCEDLANNFKIKEIK